MSAKEGFAVWRANVRKDRAFRNALLDWCNRWTTVALAADYMRQHSAGLGSDYRWLLPKDQIAVVRSILDVLAREGRVERVLGPGEKFSEVWTYRKV